MGIRIRSPTRRLGEDILLICMIRSTFFVTSSPCGVIEVAKDQTLSPGRTVLVTTSCGPGAELAGRAIHPTPAMVRAPTTRKTANLRTMTPIKPCPDTQTFAALRRRAMTDENTDLTYARQAENKFDGADMLELAQVRTTMAHLFRTFVLSNRCSHSGTAIVIWQGRFEHLFDFSLQAG